MFRLLAIHLLAFALVGPNELRSQSLELPIQTGTDDLRLSTLNVPVQPLSSRVRPQVAVSPDGGHAIVVWAGDDAGFTEIFSRRVDLPGGTLPGPEIRISQHFSDFDGERPDLTCDWQRARCLVLWDRYDNVADRWTVIGTLINATSGGPVSAEFNFSPDGGSGASCPQSTYSAERDEYVMAFGCRSTSSGALNIGVTWLIDGSNPLTLNFLEAFLSPIWSDFLYDPIANAYLLTWTVESATDNIELFAIYLDPEALEYSATRQISFTGDGTTAFNVVHDSARMARDPGSGRTLVVWPADGNGSTGDGENEIYGQFIEPAPGTILDLVEVGPEDFRISVTGGPSSRDALGPSAAFDPRSGRYIVAWHTDDFSAGFANNHFEIFAQGVENDGTLSRSDALQVSTMGAPNDPDFDGVAPSIGAADGTAFLAWKGADSVDGVREEEMWGQSLQVFSDPFTQDGIFRNGFEG